MIKIYSLLIFLLLSVCSTTDAVTTDTHIYANERLGIKYHKKGNYKKAFKKLHDSAMWGLKDSQYFLGIMYLKGQYVEQDIIKGMGYLGVSNEVEIKQRKQLFDNIYKQLSDQQKAAVNIRVEEYIKKIGLKAKSRKCVKTKEMGSSVGSRRIVTTCDFYKRNIEGGVIE